MAVSSEWKEVQGDLSAAHRCDGRTVAVVTATAVCLRLRSSCGSTSSTNTERKWLLSDRKWTSSTTTCWMPKGPAHLRTSPSHHPAKVSSALILGGKWRPPPQPSPCWCFQLQHPVYQGFLPRRRSSRAFWDIPRGSAPLGPLSLVGPRACDLRLPPSTSPLTVFVCSSGVAPPFPPNQFGAGRGSYDNFRGHLGGGGVPKQRHSRWEAHLVTLDSSCCCSVDRVCVCLSPLSLSAGACEGILAPSSSTETWTLLTTSTSFKLLDLNPAYSYVSSPSFSM